MDQETPQVPQAPNPQTSQGSRTEEFRLNGDEILGKIRELIHEGNVRRISLRNAEGQTIAEFPLSVGVIGTLVAPQLAAIGAIVALVSDHTIVVERKD